MAGFCCLLTWLAPTADAQCVRPVPGVTPLPARVRLYLALLAQASMPEMDIAPWLSSQKSPPSLADVTRSLRNAIVTSSPELKGSLLVFAICDAWRGAAILQRGGARDWREDKGIGLVVVPRQEESVPPHLPATAKSGEMFLKAAATDGPAGLCGGSWVRKLLQVASPALRAATTPP